MIILDVEQGTPEWLEARCGVVTASEFSKIITGTGKITTGETRKKYLYRVVAESITKQPEESFQSEWMRRGNELEPEARCLHELMTNTTVVQIGMGFLNDERRVSCSPDGLIGEDSGLEIKCPKLSTHLQYIEHKKIPNIYIPQVQGCLWVSGRETWVFQSYHPSMPYWAIQVERDEKYISLLEEAVMEFVNEIDKTKEMIWN